MNPPPVDVVDRNPPAVVEVAADTCDACPAVAHVKAFVFIRLRSGRSLAFCGSHGAHHMDALVTAGATIIDLRHLIGS
ncbi:hypothetical protein [Microbacterium sp. PAMC21962]|uniref:DUF7455 domain-containing protein n=1 Tax=Microbacterium sp. PAMC21962 TaxID=2861280 RepID=UPI001C630C24|nr:hypothetical protein [Microbacterium sp. PAMC21962]QYF98465.1 hypothetical protein KY498_04260 [Microbacterium sp. PAMC21962]